MVKKEKHNVPTRTSRHGWPAWPNLKEFNWGLVLGILFCLLLWVGIIWFVCKLF